MIGRSILTLGALFLAFATAGCDSSQVLERFQEQVADFNPLGTKKRPLPGERKALFPNGVPGVQQGVPAELMRGYQPPPETSPTPIEATATREPPAQPTRSAAPPARSASRSAGAGAPVQITQPVASSAPPRRAKRTASTSAQPKATSRRATRKTRKKEPARTQAQAPARSAPTRSARDPREDEIWPPPPKQQPLPPWPTRGTPPPAANSPWPTNAQPAPPWPASPAPSQ